jgi:hypothetical protein
MSFIETGIVSAEEVLLPYQIVSSSGEMAWGMCVRSDKIRR